MRHVHAHPIAVSSTRRSSAARLRDFTAWLRFHRAPTLQGCYSQQELPRAHSARLTASVHALATLIVEPVRQDSSRRMSLLHRRDGGLVILESHRRGSMP